MGSKLNNKESYQFIKSILMEIQNLNKEEQVLYVKQAGEKHPELLSSLMKMLSISNSDIVDILEQPAMVSYIPEINSTASTEEPLLSAGTKINDYEIKQHLGSGGMGHVYAAQQNFPAQRMVALKLLKNNPNQNLLMAETQILAHLNHPNIATLYEIDKSKDGQFFIAMELIEGEDIISWCRSHHYSVKQTIKIFQQLCSGINFAHDQNIIHCDIKPNNVLVTYIDGVATVKIIDFGISQFGDQQDSHHEISGTPAYLAPEVLNGKGTDQPDARRDVFALGVLLQKLLPVTLAFDLHAIIDKAKAYDKFHRYNTVKKVSDDLNRYLSKQKISARESSVWYGTKLLIQRRFEIVLVITLILLFSLTSGFVAQYKQANAAKLAQKEAEELSIFLTDIFNASNPERRNGSATTSDDLLQNASEKLLAIKTPSLSDARFMHTIGGIYTRIEKLPEAKTMIEKSLQIKRTLLTENHAEIIVGISQLGLIYKKTGEFKLSEKNLVTAIKKSQLQKEVDKTQLANYHNFLGNLYIETDQLNKAIEQHELAIKLRMEGDDLKLLADSYNNLGVIYNNNLDLENAIKYYYLAHDIFVKEYEEKHPFIGVIKNNLAIVEEKMLHFKKYEDLMKQAWNIWQFAYGESHSNTITAQRNLAAFYNRRSRYQEAINIYQALIDSLGKEHNTELQAKYMSLMARSYANLKDYQVANQHHQKALELVAGQSIKEVYLFSRLHSQYALTLMDQADYTTAKEQINIAIEFLNAKYPKDNYHRLYTINLLADVYYQSKDYRQSIMHFESVLSQNDQTKVKNQKQQVDANLGLGRIYHNQIKLNKSQDLLTEALSLSQAVYGDNHAITASIYYELAILSLSQEELDQAGYLSQKALDVQQVVLPPKHKDLIATQKLIKSLKLL